MLLTKVLCVLGWRIARIESKIGFATVCDLLISGAALFFGFLRVLFSKSALHYFGEDVFLLSFAASFV
jgi:hypothetical protein